MPLLSPLTDRVAWDEVIRRQPEINRVVAEDVSRDAVPKIDRLTDRDFGRLGREWSTIRHKTNAAFGLTTLRWAARSTDSVATIWTHADHAGTTRDSCVPVPEVAQQLEATDEIVVFTSENAVATLLSQYFPAGLRLTDSQLQQLQSSSERDDSVFSPEKLKRLLAVTASVEPAAASLFTLEFSPESPLAVRFVDGDVRVTTTFQIHPKLGASSGWMTTTFNLRGKRLPEDYWTVAVHSVDVGSATGESSGIAAGGDVESRPALTIPSEEEFVDGTDVTTIQAGTAWFPIMRAAATSLAGKIPTVKIPMEFDAAEFLPGTPRMRLSRIDSANGMLSVALKIVD